MASNAMSLQNSVRKSNILAPLVKKPLKHFKMKLSFGLFPLSIRLLSNRELSQSCTGTTQNEVKFDEDVVNKIKRLQNGSDVRGVAVEGEKGRTVDLTPQAVAAITESFGEWVTEGLQREGKTKKSTVKISLGRDPRISGAELSEGVFAGLEHAGCLVFDMGLATTPACFMSTLLPPFAYDASIMMTASHLPYTRNGLKFFTPKGGLCSVEVEEICDRAAHKYAIRVAKDSTISNLFPPTRVDFMGVYAKHLRDIIKKKIQHPINFDTPLTGFKIIVNAGNGSGGFFALDVLDKLGADTSGSLNLEPDGMFPNHIPNPEDKIAMSITKAAVLSNSADLGIVFDTDVDRSGVVDNAGNAINGDRLIALMSAIVLREHPKTTIVTDARTSLALTRFITERGGQHCLYRVGYRNVIDKGAILNQEGIEAHLMMETSGHGALKENYFLDDGAYMVLKIIIEMVHMKLAGSKEGIGSLIKDLEDPKESIELRMNILTTPALAKHTGTEAIEMFQKYIKGGKLRGWELDSCGDCWVTDGCLADSNDTPTAIDAHMYRAKVLNEDNEQHGWVHIRQSIHNPNIAINMQSSIPGGCKILARVLLDRFLIENQLDKVLDVTEVAQYARYS